MTRAHAIANAAIAASTLHIEEAQLAAATSRQQLELREAELDRLRHAIKAYDDQVQAVKEQHEQSVRDIVTKHETAMSAVAVEHTAAVTHL